MSETFKATKVLGPLVLMVRSIAIQNVLPFLALYGGFFCMWLTMLFGLYKGMGAATSLWDTTKLLFRFTINPDNAYFDEYAAVDKEGNSVGQDGDGGFLLVVAQAVQLMWILLASIVLLNVLIGERPPQHSETNEPKRRADRTVATHTYELSASAHAECVCVREC
eukprot:6822490-Prymnesium_polylepis.1